ncbi:MAG: hypothetical protein L7U87_06470, partial [Chlamydiales bacterium]|nr:hypothetical protein [Chlamydiales bacterium]
MENYKVFIPTAGIGSRVNENAPHINKALISVGYKPVISHIIDKFPKNIEIVIALGYKKDFVRDFLELAYPERKITFVEISNYDKEGSGLGLTLLECKDHLQCPFIFSSNDTIVEEHIPEPSYNWMAYADAEDTTEYRSVRVKNNSVYEICSKGATGDALAYIGLAGIHNFQDFWSAMEEGKDKGSIAIGESYGLKFLIEHGISTSKFTWHDTGNPQALKVTKQHFDSKKDINVLEKETEAIWFVDQRVVKF